MGIEDKSEQESYLPKMLEAAKVDSQGGKMVQSGSVGAKPLNEQLMDEVDKEYKTLGVPISWKMSDEEFTTAFKSGIRKV